MYKFNLMFSVITLTFVAIFLGSCSTHQRRSIASLSEPKGEFIIDLEQLVGSEKTGRQILDAPPATPMTPEKIQDLKKAIKEKANVVVLNKVVKNKATIRQVFLSLKKYEFKNLENASLEEVLKASEKLNQHQVENVILKILEMPKCELSPQFNLAFASLSERQFPDPEAQVRAARLYDRTFECGQGELRSRAAYRLGLFSLAEGKCESSAKYWPIVRESPDAKFLFSRAQYWQNYCEVEKSKGKGLAADLYNEFPLSFHALKELEDEGESASAIVKLNKPTKAIIRTSLDEDVNLLIAQVEWKIENKKNEEAKSLLRSVPEETWKKLEPHFLLYVGHLASLSQSGLVTFQVLARALSQYPSLKTTTSMKLFYPRWYLPEVTIAAKKQGLEPLFVMALIRQESAFEKTAVSPAGARGLMQLMPATARMTLRGTTKMDLLKSEKNLEVGTRFLAKLIKRFDGNLVLALAAYNAGPGAVEEWKERYKVGNPLLFKDLIPYRETREYVASILRNWYWYQVLESEAPPRPLLIGNFQSESDFATGRNKTFSISK